MSFLGIFKGSASSSAAPTTTTNTSTTSDERWSKLLAKVLSN